MQTHFRQTENKFGYVRTEELNKDTERVTVLEY